MEALRNLINNAPGWQTRLDILSSEIDKRQAELAAAAAAEGRSSDARSLRNKGSTESLKPKDDGPSFIGDADEPDATPAVDDKVNGIGNESMGPPAAPDTTPQTVVAAPIQASPNGASSSQRKHAREYPPLSNPKLRAQVKRRQRSSSVISTDEEVKTTYRTRSAIIVFYDSHVQSFFDELVRFISSSRNLMRKAKMAAKVAQIKRMAEAAVPDDNANGDDKDGMDSLPSLRYMSTRRSGVASRLGGNQAPDIYDTLDKSLDFVQSTCEHGAHQFLRDADCHEEIRKIQKRLSEVVEAAKTEVERIEREEPELAKETLEMGKPRLHRPISMRRDMPLTPTNGIIQMKEQMAKLEAAKPEPHDKIKDENQIIEVDTSLAVDEDNMSEKDMPMLYFRSTRNMRGPRPS
jgi:hypothetical protein